MQQAIDLESLSEVNSGGEDSREMLRSLVIEKSVRKNSRITFTHKQWELHPVVDFTIKWPSPKLDICVFSYVQNPDIFALSDASNSKDK